MRIRILLLLAFTISLLTLKAQDYKVISVEPLPLDMTARDYIKQDERGRQCAVFRIVTQNIAPELREGFHFECDWNSFVVARTLREGEIWVWVSPGIKTLKIKHEKLGPWDLHLTQYLPKVESLFTYRIVLQGTTNDNEEVAQQYLTFQITPTNAMLEVDGEIWPVTWDGTARKRVKEGTYTYLVQAPNYESAKGEVNVEDTAVVVRVSLKTIPLVNKKTNRWETFITLNGSYAPFSMGFSVGMVKRFGWFVSAMTNGSFTGMGDFQIPDERYKSDIGAEVRYMTPEVVTKYLAQVTEEEIDAEIASDRQRFCFEITKEDDYRACTRSGLAVRKWMAAEGIGSATVNFLTLDICGLPKMPFPECCKLLARGQGYAGEGDVLTAGLVGALFAAYPNTTFTEMFCPDWEQDIILLSHMGESNPNLSSGKPHLVDKKFNYNTCGNTSAIYGCYRGGDVTIVNLAPMKDTFNLILCPGKLLDIGLERGAYGSSTQGWFRPSMPLPEFLKAYSLAGGTHHSAMVYDAELRELEAFGEMMGFDVFTIGE